MAESDKKRRLPYPKVNISGGNFATSFTDPINQPSTSRPIAFKTPFLLPSRNEGRLYTIILFTEVNIRIGYCFIIYGKNKTWG